MSVPSLEDASVTKVRPMEASAHAPILVVEDERDLAEEIRCELEAGGHPVTLSDTVEDALKAARAGGASVLVVDRMLHGEDGLSIVETLRSEGNATPVLVISALSSVDERINGLKAGGDDYLVKPVDMLPREFKLLEYFMRRPGQIVTRAMLLEDVWNFKFLAQTNVVDVQIGNLRRKLDPTGARRFIVNVRAVGFKLNADD